MKNSINRCTELAKHSNKGVAQSKQGMEKHWKSSHAHTQIGARQLLGAGCAGRDTVCGPRGREVSGAARRLQAGGGTVVLGGVEGFPLSFQQWAKVMNRQGAGEVCDSPAGFALSQLRSLFCHPDKQNAPMSWEGTVAVKIKAPAAHMNLFLSKSNTKPNRNQSPKLGSQSAKQHSLYQHL